jgi:hypothetical protein
MGARDDALPVAQLAHPSALRRGAAGSNAALRNLLWIGLARPCGLAFALDLQTARRDHDDHDDQKEADDANSAIAKAVSIAAQSAAEAAEEEDHEKDQKNQTNGHDFAPSRAARSTSGQAAPGARRSSLHNLRFFLGASSMNDCPRPL